LLFERVADESTLSFFNALFFATPKMSAVAVAPFLAQQAPAGGGGGMFMLLFWGLFFAAMWFLLIAPQRKKQKEHQKMLSELKTGDEIVTSGGIYGTITNVKDDRFVVRVADNTKVEVNKTFVHAVAKKAGA
jgi:preprotein translocase subunit YajC